jgi:hypothetical protein
MLCTKPSKLPRSCPTCWDVTVALESVVFHLKKTLDHSIACVEKAQDDFIESDNLNTTNTPKCAYKHIRLKF